MKCAEETNNKIVELYENKYICKLPDALKNPELWKNADNKDKMSNIFCSGIPEDWWEKNIRIMIIGEEGYWSQYNQLFAELKNSQKWVLEFQKGQLSDMKKFEFNIGDEVFSYNKNNRSFWNRFRFLSKGLTNTAFCYGNIDSINNQNGNGKLSETQRSLLHGKEVFRILFEIIKLIEPTIVIFFGWHDKSLKHEFKELCNNNTIYPNGKWNCKNFIENITPCIYEEDLNGIHYILTYHPAYTIKNTGKYKNNQEYNNAILNQINNFIEHQSHQKTQPLQE